MDVWAAAKLRNPSGHQFPRENVSGSVFIGFQGNLLTWRHANWGLWESPSDHQFPAGGFWLSRRRGLRTQRAAWVSREVLCQHHLPWPGEERRRAGKDQPNLRNQRRMHKPTDFSPLGLIWTVAAGPALGGHGTKGFSPAIGSQEWNPGQHRVKFNFCLFFFPLTYNTFGPQTRSHIPPYPFPLTMFWPGFWRGYSQTGHQFTAFDLLAFPRFG